MMVFGLAMDSSMAGFEVEMGLDGTIASGVMVTYVG